MGKRHTTEQFIEKARKVHGDKYDYSKVEYIDHRTKVTIICPIHGEFRQIPNNHVSKQTGCPKCNVGGVQLLTLQQFILMSKRIHGEYYNYSQIIYRGMHAKIGIICPHHGVFRQTPSSHLQGYGCSQCKRNIHDVDRFISCSKEIHHNTYRYDYVNDFNMRVKIPITCPTHGVFYQYPYKHLQGEPCPNCVQQIKTQQFINEANQVHQGKFLYDRTQYTNSNTKIIVTCPIHGDFYQLPTDHLRGHGCYKCKNRHQVDNFLNKAKNHHNGKYQYHLDTYVNANTNMSIICPIHGDFQQTPRNHLKGFGCPKCGINNRRIVHKKSIERFVEQAKLVHGEQYQYDKSVYINTHTKLIITCPIHGDFEQIPKDHLRGAGCSRCGKMLVGLYSELYFENNPDIKEIPGIVYIIKYDKYLKIGISKRDVNRRFPTIKQEDVLFI